VIVFSNHLTAGPPTSILANGEKHRLTPPITDSPPHKLGNRPPSANVSYADTESSPNQNRGPMTNGFSSPALPCSDRFLFFARQGFLTSTSRGVALLCLWLIVAIIISLSELCATPIVWHSNSANPLATHPGPVSNRHGGAMVSGGYASAETPDPTMARTMFRCRHVAQMVFAWRRRSGRGFAPSRTAIKTSGSLFLCGPVGALAVDAASCCSITGQKT